MVASLDYFLPYQQAWITDPASLAIGEKSRRIGFTHCHAYGVVDRAMRFPKKHSITNDRKYWHSSADKSASIEFVEECANWARVFEVVANPMEGREEGPDGTVINTMEIVFPNNTKIIAGTSNPKFFRSKGGNVGLDEFAFHDQARELYKAAHATALFWGFTMRIWSSHAGETSYFNSLINSVKAGKLKASLHKVTIEDAVNQGLVEKIKKLDGVDLDARKQWLEELRATVPDDDVWSEEYMCLPSSDNASLLSYDLLRGCEVQNLTLCDSVDQLPGGDARLYAGYDVGRSRDLSVLWVIEKVGDVFWTRLVQPLANTDYTSQENLLNRLMANHAVRRICIDKGVIGAMLAERQTQRWGHRAEGLQFSAPVMSDLAMPLLRIFQDKLIRIPADGDVREDLHKVRKVVTSGNNVRFVADRDGRGHADRFWALALAYHAADALKLPLPASRLVKPVGW